MMNNQYSKTSEALEAIEWASNILKQYGYYQEFRILQCVYLNIHTNSNGSFMERLKNIVSIMEKQSKFGVNIKPDKLNAEKQANITFNELGVPQMESNCDT